MTKNCKCAIIHMGNIPNTHNMHVLYIRYNPLWQCNIPLHYVINCRFDTFWNAKMHEIITCITSSSSCVLNYLTTVYFHTEISHIVNSLLKIIRHAHEFKLLIHLTLDVPCFFHTVCCLPSVLICSSVCVGGKSKLHKQETSWTNRRKLLEQWGNEYRFHVKCDLTVFCFNCLFSSWIELMASEEQLLFISLYFLLHGDTFTTKPHH